MGDQRDLNPLGRALVITGVVLMLALMVYLVLRALATVLST